MKHAVLGTAGHIDHGKTRLVQALTGVDTDRLEQEKARGITIELGFAELTGEGGATAGVVDVPGHEAFVRTMVAGASGIDLVLFVVAADEGVMPQTREHLAVVELLGVPSMVVALTKKDLVEEEWLELVVSDVRDTLAPTRYAHAPILSVSAASGHGIEALRRVLFTALDAQAARPEDDLFRLPVDRAFTVRGTGTVVTGTVWSGKVATGDVLRVLPGDVRPRVRGLEVHGAAAAEAGAGRRAAVALTGPSVDRDHVDRGATLVSDAAWNESRILTVRARVLEASDWMLEHNQRVHVHVGTREVRARCALLEDEALPPGSSGWMQLRTEEAVVARAGDRLVLRSYSPVQTVGGAIVAEPDAPRRRRLDPETRALLDAIVGGNAGGACDAVVKLAGWLGVAVAELPVRAGVLPAQARGAVASAVEGGGAVVGGRVVDATRVAKADSMLASAAVERHAAAPLEPSISLAALRSVLPGYAAPGLADARLAALVARGALEAEAGGVRLPGHRVRLDEGQKRRSDGLRRLFSEAALSPPALSELPAPHDTAPDTEALVRTLERDGVLTSLAEGLWIDTGALVGASEGVRELLAGRTGLGPGDFREALPVTRKHLMPLLAHLDRIGVTLRDGDGRSVLAASPPSGS